MIDIAVAVEAGAWPDEATLEAIARRAVDAACAALALRHAGELSLLFTDDAHIRRLNAKWRGKDKATNVLSFPVRQLSPGEAPGPALGDIVLAYETVAEEARNEAKAFEHHLTHLLVHGFLHLLGYDHENGEDAETMEALERRILSVLAIPDPYAVTGGGEIGLMSMSDAKDTAPTAPQGAGEGTSAGTAGEVPRSTSAPAADEKPSLFARLSAALRARSAANLRENLADALDEGGESDSEAFSPEERAMLKNILRLREVRVEDVMIERADIEAVDRNTTLGELLVQFENSGHSRMPVFADTLDDPRGMVHIRDVLGYITRAAKPKAGRKPLKAKPAASAAVKLDLKSVDLTRSIEEAGLVRKVLFVPISMLASDLMAKMQAARTQMALVIDEYGGTDGLVSLEDVVEMVVGDIEDEHDTEEAMITKVSEGVFLADARAEIDEVAEVVGESFHPGEYGEDADSIGGLISAALGRVPARGEVVRAIAGFELDIVDADPRRVKRVRIRTARAAQRRRTQPKPPGGGTA